MEDQNHNGKIDPGESDPNNADTDGDGTLDNQDNCPIITNSDQTDSDNDDFGDVCDAFPDNDMEWLDTDSDGTGNNADTDDDNDGISDSIEASGPNGGDSNNDGILDSLQGNVSSLQASNENQDYVILESQDGTSISDCQAAENPSLDDSPSGIAFNYGLFDFTINDIPPGGNVVVTITLPAHEVTPDTYYKYGITPDNDTDHWYEFLFDGETGAEIDGNIITLHFTDAQRGDDVLIQDSMIIDQGGPGFFTPVATITSPESNVSINTGESVNFQCSVFSGNPPFTYLWDFNGGAANSPEKDPGNVTFQEEGTYTVYLTVKDADDDSGSDSVKISVDTPPVDESNGGGGGGGCFIDTL